MPRASAMALRARRGDLPPQLATVKGRVLGLDLALGACGWAVVDSTNGRLQLVATGVIRLPNRRVREDRAAWNVRRFGALRQALCQLLVRHTFQLVAYEYPDRPFRTHWRTTRSSSTQRTSAGSEFNAAQGLGLAEGFLIGCLADLSDLGLRAITIGLAKQVVTGNANASKDQVRTMLTTRFGWNLAGKQPDEADAAAIASACIYSPVPTRKARAAAA